MSCNQRGHRRFRRHDIRVQLEVSLETRIDPDVAISQSWKMLRTSSAIRDEIGERDNDCNMSYDGCKIICGYAIRILIYKGNSPLPSFFSFRLPPRPKSPLASPRPVTCMFNTGLSPARPACGIDVVLLILFRRVTSLSWEPGLFINRKIRTMMVGRPLGRVPGSPAPSEHSGLQPVCTRNTTEI